MKMKKLTALALTATMAASLAACGQNSSKGETDTSAANSETTASETAESTENKSDIQPEMKMFQQSNMLLLQRMKPFRVMAKKK